MTGKPGLDKVLTILNLVVVLGSAGLVIYSHALVKPAPTDIAGEEGSLVGDANIRYRLTPVKMKKITVNLSSRKTRLRYLDMEMNVLTFDEDQKRIITDSTALINDVVIRIAGNMKAKELNSLTGKMLFKSRVKKQINITLGETIAKEIIFSRFVVQ